MLLLAKPQLINFLDRLEAPPYWPEEGRTFEEVFWPAMPLVCHLVGFTFLLPMAACWPMPRWPRRRRKPVLRLVK